MKSTSVSLDGKMEISCGISTAISESGSPHTQHKTRFSACSSVFALGRDSEKASKNSLNRCLIIISLYSVFSPPLLILAVAFSSCYLEGSLAP